jgi:hypothetical protein
MANLKKRYKKLLAEKIASEIMEYLTGLNEKNESQIQRIAEKSSRNLVQVYYELVTSQNRKVLKGHAKREKKWEAAVIEMPVNYSAKPDLIAS